MAATLRINALIPDIIRVYDLAQTRLTKHNIIEVMRLLTGQQADQFLLTLLNTETLYFRKITAIALQRRKGLALAEPLLAVAQDRSQDLELRRLALAALNNNSRRSYMYQILPFLSDPEAVVRGEALYIVGTLGTPAYASYLEPLLNDTGLASNNETIGSLTRKILNKWNG